MTHPTRCVARVHRVLQHVVRHPLAFAGVPRGPAVPRTLHRTRKGPIWEGEGESGDRERAGSASILLGRGLAGKEAVKERAEGRRRGGDARECQGVPDSML